MAEKIREVRTFELIHECDEQVKGERCGEQMRATGEMLEGTRPPRMKHMCPKCKNVRFLSGMYPQMISLPVNFPVPKQWEPLIDHENFRGDADGKKVLLS